MSQLIPILRSGIETITCGQISGVRYILDLRTHFKIIMYLYLNELPMLVHLVSSQIVKSPLFREFLNQWHSMKDQDCS